MRDVAITKIIFRSVSGECTDEIEKALQELTKTIKYHAKKMASEHGLTVEIEEM